MWNLIINEDIFDLLESESITIESTSIQHCLDGSIKKIPSLDLKCLMEYRVFQDQCERKVIFYSTAIVNFYLENILQLTDPAQIPQDMLFIRLFYLYFFESVGDDASKYHLHFKKLDDHFKHLIFIPDFQDPNKEVIWSFLKELQIHNLSMLGLYYKISRNRWALEIEQYEASNEPNPIFTLALKVYVHERFQEYDDLNRVIHEYIEKGNNGGWGYYYLARKFAIEGNLEKSKYYTVKALKIEPDNSTFKYTYKLMQDQDVSHWHPVMFFGSFKDRKGELLLSVANPVEPWQTFYDSYYE